MPQIPPIDNAYIDEIIKAAEAYDPTLNKTQGIRLRELVKKLRDRFEQENTNSLVSSGTYLPVLTNVTNIEFSISRTCHYIRIGNEVKVQGNIYVSTGPDGGTDIELTLPIASNLNSIFDLSGEGVSYASKDAVAIMGSLATNQAKIVFTANGFESDIWFSFTYTVHSSEEF